jgi:hypothetical protein
MTLLLHPFQSEVPKLNLDNLWRRDTSQYLITRDQSRSDNGNIIEVLIDGVPVFVALPHLSQEQKAGVYRRLHDKPLKETARNFYSSYVQPAF